MDRKWISSGQRAVIGHARRSRGARSQSVWANGNGFGGQGERRGIVALSGVRPRSPQLLELARYWADQVLSVATAFFYEQQIGSDEWRIVEYGLRPASRPISPCGAGRRGPAVVAGTGHDQPDSWRRGCWITPGPVGLGCRRLADSARPIPSWASTVLTLPLSMVSGPLGDGAWCPRS